MSRPFIVAAGALAIVALAPGVTLAQVGTPTPDFVTPDPAECQIAPRSIDSIASALATPVAGTPTVVSPDSDSTAGQPADAETIEAVITLAREATACGNAGDYRRVFALYTDNGLRVFAADRGMAAEQIVGFLAATPVAPPAEAWQGVRIRDVRVLSDGRVTAFIDFLSPKASGPSSWPSSATAIATSSIPKWRCHQQRQLRRRSRRKLTTVDQTPAAVLREDGVHALVTGNGGLAGRGIERPVMTTR